MKDNCFHLEILCHTAIRLETRSRNCFLFAIHFHNVVTKYAEIKHLWENINWILKKDKFTTERSQFVDTKVLENTSGLSCGGGPAPQAPEKCETNDEAWPN